MFFVTDKSLSTHLALYCTGLQQHPKISPNEGRLLSPKDKNMPSLIPHRKSSPPTKRIGIQIRKVYKTEEDEDGRRLSLNEDNFTGSVPSLLRINPNISLPISVGENNFNERSNNNVEASNKVRISYPNCEGPLDLSKIEENMTSFCDLKKYTCIPCKKKFYSYTNIKRHAAIHMNWTRFACLVCGFRSYNKFVVVKHLSSEHGINDHDANNNFEQVHYLNDSFKSDLNQLTREELYQTLPDIDSNDYSNVDPLEMVDVVVEEIVYPNEKKDNLEETDTDESEEQNEMPKTEEDSSNKSATKEIDNEESPIKDIKISTILPKTMTIKLKKVNINALSCLKSKGSVLEQTIKNISRSKSLDSEIIKTVTVTAKNISVVPKQRNSPNKSNEKELQSDKNTRSHSVSGDENETEKSISSKSFTLPSPVSSSRQRRITRLPAKRKYPDSPSTFTGVSTKKNSLTKSKKIKINILSLTSKKTKAKSE